MRKFIILAEVSHFRYFVAIDADGYSLEGLAYNATKFDSHELATDAMNTIEPDEGIRLSVCNERGESGPWMPLPDRLKQLRAEAGFTQQYVTDALGLVGHSVYGQWETGVASPGLDKIVRLADLYGITVDELVKGRLAIPAK